MKVDIDCAVNLENTHMDGHGMSLSDHVTGVGRAYCSGDRIISLGTIEQNYLPGNYWASFWDATADLVTPLVAQVVLRLHL